jgi:hypothetical protein
METSFETMLISKGYIKHILNCKTMKFELAIGHTVSSMVNLDHRYIHHTNEPLLAAIKAGKSVMDKDFPCRKEEIVYGLNEMHKPPTLVWPRPIIRCKRLKDEKVIIENEQLDDSMNVVLKDIDHEQIYQALFDKTKIFNFDFTNQAS